MSQPLPETVGTGIIRSRCRTGLSNKDKVTGKRHKRVEVKYQSKKNIEKSKTQTLQSLKKKHLRETENRQEWEHTKWTCNKWKHSAEDGQRNKDQVKTIGAGHHSAGKRTETGDGEQSENKTKHHPNTTGNTNQKLQAIIRENNTLKLKPWHLKCSSL